MFSRLKRPRHAFNKYSVRYLIRSHFFYFRQKKQMNGTPQSKSRLRQPSWLNAPVRPAPSPSSFGHRSCPVISFCCLLVLVGRPGGRASGGVKPEEALQRISKESNKSGACWTDGRVRVCRLLNIYGAVISVLVKLAESAWL